MSGNKSEKIYLNFLFYYLGILLCWFPSFLGLYPGLFTYDSTGQLEMVKYHEITTHHPVIHTLFLGGLANLSQNLFGGVNKGVMLYTVIQMLIMAFCFAYVLDFARKAGIKKWLILVFLLWFGFFPPNVVLVMSCTKDSLFSAFLVLFVVKCIELFDGEEEYINNTKKMFFWTTSAFLTIIFRNNALYAMTLFLPIVFIMNRKNVKKLLLFVGILLLSFVLYRGPFCSLFTVEGTHSKEYLSVPCQQIVSVYLNHEQELEENEALLIRDYFSEVAFDYYNPKIADATKYSLDWNKVNSDQKKFWKLYLNLGFKYPGDYCKAFVLNSMDYYIPTGNMVLDIQGTKGYLSIECREPAISKPIIPFIWDYYQNFVNTPLVQGNPVTTFLFSPALQFYLLLATTVILMLRKRYRDVTVLVFVWLTWLTFLLGPVVLVRYCIYLYYLLPLEITLCVRNNDRI